MLTMAPGMAQTIVDELCDNSKVFNGWGRHTANDVLYDMAIWPLMPIRIICNDNDLFHRLKQGLVKYVSQWAEPTFLTLAAGDYNGTNPFDFH